MKFTWNFAEYRRLRTSPQTQALLKKYADKLAAEANEDHQATALSPIVTGDSYEVAADVTKDRARAFVQTANPRAMAHEQRSSSLLRVIAR